MVNFNRMTNLKEIKTSIPKKLRDLKPNPKLKE